MDKTEPDELSEMRHELNEKLEKQKKRTEEQYPVFWFDELEEVISIARLRKLFQYYHYNTKRAGALAELIRRSNHESSQNGSSSTKSYIRIVGILIYIDWNRWEIFERIFIETNRGDDKLPFEGTVLEGLRASSVNVNMFREYQYKFIPATITTGKEIKSISLPYFPPFYSPLAVEKAKRGYGGSGEVYQCTVRRVHLPAWKSQDESLRMLDYKNVDVAVKVMSSSDICRHRELENLQNLHESINSTKHLVVFFGAFTRENSTYIIFPLATQDLDSFLKCSVPTAKILTLNSARGVFDSPDIVDIARFYKVFVQLAGVAHALDYLHSGRITNDGNSHKCAHMDLTSRNILVFSQAIDDVGIWKITDFGISKMKRSYERKDFAHTYAMKGSDLYGAPEVANSKVGIEGDIWSMGVIFFMVISYLLGKDIGSLEARIKGTDSNNSGNFYIKYPEGPPCINPEIRKILEEFRVQSGFARTFLSYPMDLLLGKISTDLSSEDEDEELEKVWRECPQSSNRGMLIIQDNCRIHAKDLATKFDAFSRKFIKLARRSSKQGMDTFVVDALHNLAHVTASSLRTQTNQGLNGCSEVGSRIRSSLWEDSNEEPHDGDPGAIFEMNYESKSSPSSRQSQPAVFASGGRSSTSRPLPTAISRSGEHQEQSSPDTIKAHIVFRHPTEILKALPKANVTKVILSTLGDVAAFVDPDVITLYHICLDTDTNTNENQRAKSSKLIIGNVFSFASEGSWKWVDVKVHGSLFVGMLANENHAHEQLDARRKLKIYKFTDKNLTSRRHRDSNRAEEVQLGEQSPEITVDDSFLGFHIMDAGQLVRVYRTYVLVQLDFSIASPKLRLDVNGQIWRSNWVSLSADMCHLAIFCKCDNPDHEASPVHYLKLAIGPDEYRHTNDFYCSKSFFSLATFTPFSTTKDLIASIEKKKHPQELSPTQPRPGANRRGERDARHNPVLGTSLISGGKLLRYDHKRKLNQTESKKSWVETVNNFDVLKLIMTPDDRFLFLLHKYPDTFEILVFQVISGKIKTDVEKKASFSSSSCWIEGSDIVVRSVPDSMDYYVLVADPRGSIQTIRLCISN